MDDLKRVAFFQGRGAMRLARNDITIELHDDAARPDLKLVE